MKNEHLFLTIAGVAFGYWLLRPTSPSEAALRQVYERQAGFLRKDGREPVSYEAWLRQRAGL